MSMKTFTGALAELEARAGASDKDRPAWLAERATGLTATGVRDLRIKAQSSDSMAAEKLGWESEAELSSIPRVKYGKDREAVIARRMAGKGFAPESRVFFHPENSRYLASPDGVREEWDGTIALLEVKTDEHDIANDDEAWAATGYEFQCQWQMFVIGAQVVVVAVEQCREVSPGVYEPVGEIELREVHRDEEIIAELRAIADSFLAKLDDYAANGRPALGMALVADAITKKAEAEAARDAAEAWFASTGTDSLKVPGVGSASYGVSAPRRSLDQAALKAAHPGVVEEFTKVTPANKPTFRLTPARTKETKK